MPKQFWLSTFTLTASLMLMSGCASDERTTRVLAPVESELESTGSELESTERNVRDSGGATLTPEDQGGSRGDLEITAAIRRTVVNDESLSLNAHNAKIITRNGVVTLRGPVESSAEKIKLQSIAQKVPGVKQVDNQLETKMP